MRESQIAPARGLDTILVPLDGSTASARALPYAAELASAAGARVVLVRAVRAAGDPEEHARLADEADEGLRVASDWLAGRGVGVWEATSVCPGEAGVAEETAAAIVGEAARQVAGMVVMCSPARRYL